MNLRRASLSIRTTLLLTISLLTLFIGTMAAREVNQQWRQLEHIQRLKQATQVNEHFFHLIEYFSQEREFTFAVLKAKDATVSEALRQQMVESRQKVDTILETLRDDLRNQNYSVGSNEMIGLPLRDLRQKIDNAIALPRAERDPQMANLWLAIATGFLNQSFDQWMRFTQDYTKIDSIVTQRMMFQHFLGLLIRYSGRERALISGMLAANEPIGKKDQALLLQWRGVTDQGWEMCEKLAKRSELAPEITPYLNDAHSHYLTIYDMVEELFYVPGSTPTEGYPISIEQWLEVAQGSTDSLVALKNQALKQTRFYVSTLEQQAKQAIAFHIAIFGVALLLCLVSFAVISQRVIGPIRQMVTALLDTLAGKTIEQLPIADYQQDEIGQLADVLASLQKHMEARSLLAAIVESSDDAIISTSPDSIITSWNRGAERMFGYTPEEAVGQSVMLIIPLDRRDEEPALIARSRQGNKVEHFETVRVAKSGQPIDISLTFSPIFDSQGVIIGTSKIIHDIRERKQAEHKLLESTERYRALVEAGTQVVWTWKEGEILQDSPLWQWWEKTTGQPASDIATYGWLDFVHPQDKERAREIWADAIAQSKNFEVEYRLRTRTGDYRHVYVRAVALKNPNGSVREFIGSLNDITERKENEERLARYMRDLEQSNKELDDFAYIASHDLKEPLRGLHNHSRFLLEDNENKLDIESVDRLHRLLYLTQRMEKLVNDLLYFSRLGRQELAIQPTDLNEVVQDITQMSADFLSERHAKIVIPKPLPTIIADKTRITEVFRNLITNAAKYNDKPEKLIEIGMEDTHKLPEGDVAHRVFYVKDNGIGIPVEFSTEVFRIFKRLQSPKKGEEEGTGVGLTFVKKIIERHGGRIWLESTPGQGTIFYFTLERQSYDDSSQ